MLRVTIVILIMLLLGACAVPTEIHIKRTVHHPDGTVDEFVGDLSTNARHWSNLAFDWEDTIHLRGGEVVTVMPDADAMTKMTQQAADAAVCIINPASCAVKGATP